MWPIKKQGLPKEYEPRLERLNKGLTQAQVDARIAKNQAKRERKRRLRLKARR